MGLAVLVSITAEADEEPPAGASRFASSRMIEAAGSLDRALQAARPLRAVNADGEPLPILQARLAAASDEIEPNGALKRPPLPFPEVDRDAKGNPFIGLRPGLDARRLNGALARARLDDPRLAEFDPGRSMSPERPDDGGPPVERPGLAFDDGATPGLPLEFSLNSSSPTSSDGVLVVVETDAANETTVPQMSSADGKPNYAALIDPRDNARQMRCLA